MRIDEPIKSSFLFKKCQWLSELNHFKDDFKVDIQYSVTGLQVNHLRNEKHLGIRENK